MPLSRLGQLPHQEVLALAKSEGKVAEAESSRYSYKMRRRGTRKLKLSKRRRGRGAVVSRIYHPKRLRNSDSRAK
jgi:hypothetical protein